MDGMSGPGGWPQPKSGLRRAGEVLLVVGASLQAFGALMLLLMSLLVRALVSRSGSGSGLPGWIVGLYLVLGAAAIVGVVFGFLAYGRARRGDLNGAFALGLVSALVPPINVVALLGAIFCKVCPEAQPAPPPWPVAAPR